MTINFNQINIDWAKYAHVTMEAHTAAPKAAECEVYPLNIESAITDPNSVLYYAVYGLLLNGDYELLHEAQTLEEAKSITCTGLAHINNIHQLRDIGPVMIECFEWDLPTFDLSHYNGVEMRSLEIARQDNGSFISEETDPENACCFAVYLTRTDQKNIECLATIYSIAEMEQIHKIIDYLVTHKD